VRSWSDVADAFDPIAILRTLNEGRVAFVLVGEMAEVANGSPLGFSDVEITFLTREDNVARLAATLGKLGGDTPPVDVEQPTTITTRYGTLRLTPIPPGTRGYDDVRRKAHREHLARGLRIDVADVRDLIRIENAGDGGRVRAATLQRIEAHLARVLGIDR
jgi:hypothetical protein